MNYTPFVRQYDILNNKWGDFLCSRGFYLNHKTLQQLMKQIGLVCRVRAKKYRSYKGKVGKIAPNLLNQDFYAENPNQKWVTDLTEFSMFGEKLYLSPILDLHSGYLVSYTLSEYGYDNAGQDF